jgi:hypothetical protein
MKQRAEPKSIDFKVIGEPLNRLLTAVGNKLSREWPIKYQTVTGGRELFVMNIRAAQIAFLSSLYLCGDTPSDPRRKADFCVSLPPINRATLDILFTLLFILEDVPSRCEWYHQAGWREARLELDRHVVEYGQLPEWRDWLSELTKFVNDGPHLAKLTPHQMSNPSSLRSWLTPGAMCNYEVCPGSPLSPMRAFMKYLNDFFYIDLSQQTHLAAWGMVKRTGFLLDEVKSIPSTEAQVKKYRYFQIAQTVAFVLAVASEVEAHFNFGLRQEALFLWGVAGPSIVVVDEMYQKRYRELLHGS